MVQYIRYLGIYLSLSVFFPVVLGVEGCVRESIGRGFLNYIKKLTTIMRYSKAWQLQRKLVDDKTHPAV